MGEIKRRIRPTSPHRTLGAACTNCHTPQNEWWFSDPHYASVEPFFDEEPRNLQIGRLYGLKTSEITRGNQVCMDCHATVISGRESRDVQDGVGCESCHGPAGDYIEIHKEGEKSLGESRPGYQKALEAGMVKLRDLEERAQACTGCHYIVEPRLISAGHPAGTDFDWVEAMGKIRHWERPLRSAGEIRQAFGTALRRRGPVPDVPRADLAAASSASSGVASPGSSATGSSASTGRLANDVATLSSGDDPIYVRPAVARPARSTGPAVSAPQRPAGGAVRMPLGLSAFPELDEGASIEDLLLLIQRRIERLSSALRRAGASGQGQ